MLNAFRSSPIVIVIIIVPLLRIGVTYFIAIATFATIHSRTFAASIVDNMLPTRIRPFTIVLLLASIVSSLIVVSSSNSFDHTSKYPNNLDIRGVWSPNGRASIDVQCDVIARDLVTELLARVHKIYGGTAYSKKLPGVVGVMVVDNGAGGLALRWTISGSDADGIPEVSQSAINPMPIFDALYIDIANRVPYIVGQSEAAATIAGYSGSDWTRVTMQNEVFRYKNVPVTLLDQVNRLRQWMIANDRLPSIDGMCKTTGESAVRLNLSSCIMLKVIAHACVLLLSDS